MKKVIFSIFVLLFVATNVFAVNPIEEGVKNEIKLDKNFSIISGGTASSIDSPENFMKFNVFEKKSSGEVLLKATAIIKNFNWNLMFESLRNYNVEFIVVKSKKEIVFEDQLDFFSLKSGMRQSLKLGELDAIAKFALVGPDLQVQFPCFRIKTYEKGAYSGNIYQLNNEIKEKNWNNFFKESGKWFYVGIKIYSFFDSDIKSDPEWCSGSNDSAWDAKWEWENIPESVFAVEVVKTSTGITEWKLIQRLGSQIIPQCEVKITTTPSSSQELKDNFQLNSTVSKGEFEFFGDYSDKDIWIYQQ